MIKKPMNTRKASARNRASRRQQKQQPKKAAVKKPQEQAEAVPAAAPLPENIPLDKIDLCPFNYRKYYDPKALQEFAKNVRHHGIISPATVRPAPVNEEQPATGEKRYQLVVGERRWRAAQIAELAFLPAVIRELTDSQVKEIQLAENLQREDPHPLHEAQAIADLQTEGKSIDQIAARLGKPKGYILGRAKLVNLAVSFQDMFLAGKMGVHDALQLAVLPAEAQLEIFENKCKDWETNKYFSVSNIRYLYDRYKCELVRAPFDTKDAALIPDMGACTKCPHNTATLRSLFPDENTEGRCINKGCFEKKCLASLSNRLSALLAEHKPQALLFAGSPDPYMQAAVSSNPEAAGIPVYDYYKVHNTRAPGKPQKKHYTCEKETKRGTKEVHDPVAFAEALQEYEQEKALYDQRIEAGKIQKGLYIAGGHFETILFDTEKRVGSSSGGSGVSLKQVNEAIKAKTATPTMIQAGIDRVQEREKSSQRNDREKTQERIHELFTEKVAAPCSEGLTPAHTAALRLLILRSLDWHKKDEVWEKLFPGDISDTPETFYAAVSALTDAQLAWAVEKALAGKNESKSPNGAEGFFLRQLATAVGVDVAGVDAATEAKAKDRQENNKNKILFFEMKKGMLEKTA